MTHPKDRDTDPGSDRDLPTTTGSSKRLVLTLAFAPDPTRLGERCSPAPQGTPINRSATVLPGGLLDDDQMSRTHAVVSRKARDSLHVRDAGSRNGTFVGDHRVPEAGLDLRPGEILRVGSCLFYAHMVDDDRPDDAPVDALIGHSDPIRLLRHTIHAYAPRPSPVLILGETGAGKELVAHALAELGRPGRPFVPFNLSATPATLVEAQLFGHAKDAYTGARQARKGVFREAHTGTVFIDEVGELTPEVQVKLLRVLESGEVRPVGVERTTRVDSRVVAATNRDLLAEVRTGRFRDDLYARLAFLPIRVPALRERPEDIPALAIHFARQSLGREPRFSVSAMARLIAHPWPFNVRGLAAAVEQMVVGSTGTTLRIPPSLAENLREHRDHFARDHADKSLTRETVEAALAKSRGNMAEAARILGKDRGQLYRIAKRLGVDIEGFRS